MTSIHRTNDLPFSTGDYVFFVGHPDPDGNRPRIQKIFQLWPYSRYPAGQSGRLLTLSPSPSSGPTFLVWVEAERRTGSHIGKALKQLLSMSKAVTNLSVIYHFGPSIQEHQHWTLLYGAPIQAFVDKYPHFRIHIYQTQCHMLVGDPYFSRHVMAVKELLDTEIGEGNHVVWLGGLERSNDTIVKFITAAKMEYSVVEAPNGVLAKGYVSILDGYDLDTVHILDGCAKDMVNLISKIAKRKGVTICSH